MIDEGTWCKGIVVLWASQALQNAGYPTLPANTAAMAKKLVDEFRPNLALLMIKMSLLGAIDLASSLRHTHQGIRVLAIVDEDQKIGKHGEDVVVSPCDLNDPEAAASLVRTVKSFLSHRHVA